MEINNKNKNTIKHTERDHPKSIELESSPRHTAWRSGWHDRETQKRTERVKTAHGWHQLPTLGERAVPSRHLQTPSAFLFFFLPSGCRCSSPPAREYACATGSVYTCRCAGTWICRFRHFIYKGAVKVVRGHWGKGIPPGRHLQCHVWHFSPSLSKLDGL